MARILALDYGERRIGVAISDPSATIAQPLPTIQRRVGKRPPYARIIEVIQEYEPEIIVVGLPIETSGDEGEQARIVREFGEGLRTRASLPVEYWDERFSSARAHRDLMMLGDSASKRRKEGRVDALAAALILRSFLDARRSEKSQ